MNVSDFQITTHERLFSRFMGFLKILCPLSKQYWFHVDPSFLQGVIAICDE